MFSDTNEFVYFRRFRFGKIKKKINKNFFLRNSVECRHKPDFGAKIMHYRDVY